MKDKGYSDRITKDSLNSQIAKVLTQAILSGEIAPGSPLRQADLAHRFHTSQSPVREAILILERSGLVEVVSGRGAHVVAITDAEAVELLLLRSLFESRSILQYVHSQEQGDAALQYVQEMENALGLQARQQFIECDIRFHDHICRRASSLLYQQWKVINGKVRLLMASFSRQLSWDMLAQVSASHRLVAEYLTAGQGEEAARENQKHLFHVWGAMRPDLVAQCKERMAEYRWWQQVCEQTLTISDRH